MLRALNLLTQTAGDRARIKGHLMTSYVYLIGLKKKRQQNGGVPRNKISESKT